VNRPLAAILPRGLATSKPSRSVQGLAQAHPLLGAFPLAVMTLATLLVLFAVMMARPNGGKPDLRTSTTTPLVARSPGGGAHTDVSAIALGVVGRG
jgi:hypothetical protein